MSDTGDNKNREFRAMMIEHYKSIYGERTTEFVDSNLRTDHYAGRFDYLRSIVAGDWNPSRQRLLISGFGAGSELLVAKETGFREVVGLEVDPFLVRVAAKRGKGLAGFYPVSYRGVRVPFTSGHFNVVISGHVIEHTDNPSMYLTECMRVLVPGGFLSLEFPHRFHTIELHTGLRSYEFLPQPLRNSILDWLSGPNSRLEEGQKSGYRSIRNDLQQISMPGILWDLWRYRIPFRLRHVCKPAAGITRCVIQKG